MKDKTDLTMNSALRVDNSGHKLSWETFIEGSRIETSRGPATVLTIQVSYRLDSDYDKDKYKDGPGFTEKLSALPPQYPKG